MEMLKLDFVTMLSYGSLGLGCILAILTAVLLAKEQKAARPRKSILKAIYAFMAFSLVLVILGLLSQAYEKKTSVNLVELPSFPDGHPGEVILRALKPMWQRGYYRQNFKWEFSFSNWVQGRGRKSVKLNLSAEFEMINSGSIAWDYNFRPDFLVSKDFQEPKEGLHAKLIVKSMQGSKQGPTLREDWFDFVRNKGTNQFSTQARKYSIEPGEHKWFRWEVENIEYDIPFHDYYLSVTPTDTMEITVHTGNTKVETRIALLSDSAERSNPDDVLLKETESGSGLFVYKAEGALLPFQGVEITFSDPETVLNAISRQSPMQARLNH